MTVKYVITAILVLAFCVPTALAGDFDRVRPDSATTMFADLDVLEGLDLKAGGRMERVEWYDADGNQLVEFSINVGVAVPAGMEGFGSYDSAMKSDVWVLLSNLDGPYAECQVVVQPVVRLMPVIYSVVLAAENDLVTPLTGICDIRLYKRGIQVGIPTPGPKDEVTAFVKSASSGEASKFVTGYCE